MESPLALSPRAAVSMETFGAETQPVVTVADVLTDPDGVIEIAARHRFGTHGAFYPGIRAAVSEKIGMPMVAPLLERLVEVFSLPRLPRFRECYLSVVTHAPAELAPIQRLPHFDGTERERLAVLLYLDKADRGGTAFYRQRATGFESVDGERFDTYRSQLEAATAEHGLPGPAYISGDTAIFEQIHRVSDTFNSMVIYRGNTLHCADLGADFVPDPDPKTGRLTLNLFLD
ncbi:DUF6445 family protein [Qipengyuania gaetbuli]|nr:DUF6445 family protein [Qipengyuania gaetbuli]